MWTVRCGGCDTNVRTTDFNAAGCLVAAVGLAMSFRAVRERRVSFQDGMNALDNLVHADARDAIERGGKRITDRFRMEPADRCLQFVEHSLCHGSADFCAQAAHGVRL